MKDDALIGQIDAIAEYAIDHLNTSSMLVIEAMLRNAADDVGCTVQCRALTPETEAVCVSLPVTGLLSVLNHKNEGDA